MYEYSDCIDGNINHSKTTSWKKYYQVSCLYHHLSTFHEISMSVVNSRVGYGQIDNSARLYICHVCIKPSDHNCYESVIKTKKFRLTLLLTTLKLNL